jgi:hypothetical protein
MAEFQFRCPRCKKQIQCDTSYIGANILCPICQQSVAVPPAKVSTGEKMIEVKVSTLKRTTIISLAVILVVALAAFGFHFFTGLRSVTFRAYVDGTDVVKLSGGQLWVEHLQWQKPDQMSINGKSWNPIWNDNTTAAYSLSHAFKPGNPDKISLTKKVGRGRIAITERPKPDNGRTLSVRVDDGPMGGADWYEFTVSW